MRSGPLYMIGAGVLFTLMVAAVKVVRLELAALEIIWWRSLIGLPIAFAFARRGGLALRGRRAYAVRIICGFGAMLCYYTAAKTLPVADLTLIAKLQPIFIAVLAPLALGASERSGWIVWVLLAAGMAGTAILLSPSLEVGNVHGIIALGGSAVGGVAHVAIRSLGSTDSPRTQVFWFHAGLALIATPAVLLLSGGEIALPAPRLVPLLLAIGITSTAAQLLMSMAYAVERAAVVATATYCGPLFALLVDWLAFDILPTGHVLLGGAIVITAGVILVFRRDRQRPDPAPDS